MKKSIKIILIIIGIIIVGFFVLLGYGIKDANNPYGWKAVSEASTQEFRDILNYKFSDGSSRLTWMEEAGAGAWRAKVVNGVEVKTIFQNWLKTTYGLPKNDESKPNYKIYLEKITPETWSNYFNDATAEFDGAKSSAKKEYKGTTYYFTGIRETTALRQVGTAYIFFPERYLGIYLYFYNYQPISNQKAEVIIMEIIDHVKSLK